MSDMNDSDSHLLARIDERTSAQTQNFATHVKSNDEQFDNVFKFVTKGFDKVDVHLDKIDKRLDALYEDKNERKGAWNLSKIISGVAYAILAIMAGIFGGSLHK